MSRRRAPRAAREAIQKALQQAAPKTPLAAVQAVWSDVVGEHVAAASRPVSERDGTVIVACSEPVWAEELDLMQERLQQALRERLGAGAPQRLRFRVEKDGD